MLILKTDRDALLKPLQMVSGVVAKVYTAPILSNVLIECRASQVSLCTCDMDIQVNTLGPVSDLADFKITVNAKKLQGILSALPDGSVVELTLDDNRLLLKSGKSRFHLQTLPASEFPLMNINQRVQAAFTVNKDTLRHMISQVQYSMAVQDIRYYLNGLLLQVEGNSLRFVATDGHRLAYIAAEIDADLPATEVILSRKSVLELLKLLHQGLGGAPNELVSIEILDNQIRFLIAGTVFVAKVIEARYPDYRRVMPANQDITVTIPRVQLQGIFERTSLLANEKMRAATLSIAPGMLSVSCMNADDEEAREDLEIAYDGRAFQDNFNIVYLMDVLRHVHADEVELAFVTANRAALVKIPDHENFKYIVMAVVV